MVAQLHTLGVTLEKEIGELSHSRIELLTNNDFILSSEENGLYVLISQDENYQIILTPTSITCAFNKSIVESFFEEPEIHFGIFKKVTETLFLNPDGIISCQIEKSYETPSNSLEKAWELLHDRDLFKTEGSVSIGYRIAINNDTELNPVGGEIRVEPLFVDSKKYFIGFQMQGKHQESLEQCLVSFKKMLGIFQSYEEKAALMFI